MTTTSHSPRVPAGVPTGGQFAAQAHAEAGLALTDPVGATEGPVTVDASEMPDSVRRAFEDSATALKSCPACHGASMWPNGRPCGLCENTGKVTQCDLEEYMEAPAAPAPVSTLFYDRDTPDLVEPDYEAMHEARLDAYDAGRGEAMEWGGLDVAS